MKPHHEYDVTKGSMARNIWRLTWPSGISQMLFMLPSIYDAIWLGQLGPDAQAAAGLTQFLRFTMVSVLMGLSTGSGAVVTRHIGAKEQGRANLAALQSVIMMIVASGSLGLIGIVFARPLLALSGADSVTLPLAVRYARVMFAGLIAMEMVPSVGFMLSTAGDPQALLGMTLWSTGTLLVAEPVLVRWLGIEGAALAMVVSNAVGMVWGLRLLVTGRTVVRLNLRALQVDFPTMRRIARITLPAILQRGTPNLANSILTRMISFYGAPTLAAWTVGRRISNFALIPSMGLSRAASAMVGQNLGATQPERAARSVGLIARATMLLNGVVLGLLALASLQVMALFSRDASTISVGARMICILSVGYLGLALNNVLDAAQTGAGDTISPMIINLVSLWILQVPLAYGLSRWAGLGADGIWLALTLGWIVQAALMTWRFRQDRWQLTQI